MFFQTRYAYESLGASVERYNAVEASKSTDEVQAAGEVACWLHGLPTCWGFKGALRALDDMEPTDLCLCCGCSLSSHSDEERRGCDAALVVECCQGVR